MRGHRAQVSSVMCCRYSMLRTRLGLWAQPHYCPAVEIQQARTEPVIISAELVALAEEVFLLHVLASDRTSISGSARDIVETHLCINWRVPGYAVHGVRA